MINTLKRFAFVCLFAGSAQAYPAINSGTLLEWLKSSDESDVSLAVGYIGGVREVTYKKEHCASQKITVPEVLGAVERTLDGMPQYRDMRASLIVIATLKARWPCPSTAVVPK